jgi:trehalose synthase
MIRRIKLRRNVKLDDYASYAQLRTAVNELHMAAQVVLPKLKGRTIWAINSTNKGGGVAEMLPKIVTILRELGIRIEWVVLEPEEIGFFSLTKRIHNLIHDFGEPGFNSEDRALYERISNNGAEELLKQIGPKDILVAHDPQPLGMAAELKRRTGVNTIWRCHIGLDETTPATSSAWHFLKPYATEVDHAVFSAPEYIPSYLVGKSTVIYPAIDPLSHKNRELSAHKLVGILSNAGLMLNAQPVLTPKWKNQTARLQPVGRFTIANGGNRLGLLYRPIITQISRWDRLKGWLPLVEAFIKLRRRVEKAGTGRTRRVRRLKICRLVLAGPDPHAIQDDPEGQEVLKELCEFYQKLDPIDQESIAIVTLPMVSRKENALMVNAIQRCSTVIVQNSLREGFGLTATEAMWKRIPVLASSACGLRQQIRDGIDGCISQNPEDSEEIAEHLDQMLSDPEARDLWSRNAQRHVHERFLIFNQVQNWLYLFVDMIENSHQN